MKKLLRRFGIVLVVLLLLAALIPVLASSAPGTALLMRIVNARMPGHVSVADLRLAWMKSQKCTGITLEQPDGTRIEIESASVGRGLLPLLLDTRRLGLLKVENPRVTLPDLPAPRAGQETVDTLRPTPVEPGPAEPADARRKPTAPERRITPTPARKPKRARRKMEPVEIPSLEGSVIVSGGSVSVPGPAGATFSLIENITLNNTLNGLGQPMTFQVHADISDQPGYIELKGEIELPANGRLEPAALPIDITAGANNIDLGKLTAELETWAGSRINGLLNASVTLRGTCLEGLAIRHTATVSALALSAPAFDLGEVSTTLVGTFGMARSSLSELSIQSTFLQANGSGSVSTDGITTAELNANVQLDQLSALLSGLALLEPGMQFGGNGSLHMKAMQKGTQLTIAPSKLVIDDLMFTDGEHVYRDDNVSLEQHLKADLAKMTVTITTARLACAVGTITAIPIEVRNALAPQPAVDLNATVDSNLGQAAAALSDFLALPPGTVLDGTLRAELKMHVNEDGSAALALENTISDFELASTNGMQATEERITLKAEADVAAAGQSVSVKALTLNSAALELDATATYKVMDDAQRVEVQGELGAHLAKLEPYVGVFSPVPIVMQGDTREPFTFTSTWTGPAWPTALREGQAKAALQADRIELLGLHISEITVPLKLEERHLDLDLRARVNEGTLELLPRIDFEPETPILDLSRSTNILTDVQLTSEMADELLGLIHPLFRGASVTDGIMSMQVYTSYWPLAGNGAEQAVIEGKVFLKDLKLASAGLVRELLETMKVREREADIGDRDIDFALRDGRIATSPTKLRIEGHRVVISGTMGIDQTLDYRADLPITERLVGRDAYKYLEGKSLTVPIRGTAEQPYIDALAFEQSAADLATEALSKFIEDEATKFIEGLFGK
jgi:hypothetical protein